VKGMLTTSAKYEMLLTQCRRDRLTAFQRGSLAWLQLCISADPSIDTPGGDTTPAGGFVLGGRVWGPPCPRERGANCRQEGILRARPCKILQQICKLWQICGETVKIVIQYSQHKAGSWTRPRLVSCPLIHATK